MVIFPNKTHPLLMVKLRDQLGRVITSLLSLTLVSAVLMLGSPALAHDVSGSTCGADVVLLFPRTQILNVTRKTRAKDLRRRRESCLHGSCTPFGGETRHDVGLAMEGHAKSLMASPMLKGADIRFGIAGHIMDPLALKTVGSYGDDFPGGKTTRALLGTTEP